MKHWTDPFEDPVVGVEKVWDKYAVSSQQLERDRENTLTQLNEFLNKLGYLG